MSAPPVTALEHLGVLYEDRDTLVASTGPRVAAALADGDDVFLAVDRRTARGFREWLGPAGDRVEYPSPADWPRDPVRDLRSIARSDRRTLVLGQYTASGNVGDEHARFETGINLVLGDLPMTLLCTCAHDAGPVLLDALHTCHPGLLVDGEAVTNSAFRAPAPDSPVPATIWGPPTLRLDFSAPVDLRRVRERVVRVAEAAGMRGDTVDDAVQAVHEAAVIAAGGPDAAALDHAGSADEVPRDERAVPCVLEVRADAGVLYCEVRGAHRAANGNGNGHHGYDEHEALRIVRLFCDRAVMREEPEARSVRLLRAPSA